jgi:energy-coupling factor transport system ATP-binding protein
LKGTEHNVREIRDDSVIQFRQFGFRYEHSNPDEDWALWDIDLAVDSGEVALVLGRSGCGKSTLGLAVNGIVPHVLEGETVGEISVCGLSVLDTPLLEMSRHVGMVFQDPDVQLFALTVEDELAMSLESFGVPQEEMRRRVDWAVSVCGLEGLEMRAPGQLSGGQKQRVAIAAVIARQPDILVFDEPTGNLDPVRTRRVYNVIRRICEEQQTTVLLVEHDLASVIDIVDTVVVLQRGRIVFKGSPRELMSRLELLRSIGAKIPIASQLGDRLMRKGLVDYPLTPLLPEEVAGPIVSALGGGDGYRLKAILPSGNDASSGNKGTLQACGDHQDSLVSFRSVTHRYPTGTVALDDVNLDIGSGDFVGLVGKNGAGKTTLAQHVLGILAPSEGDVVVHGQNTRDRSVAELARYVGLIFQNPNDQLIKDTVESELRFGPANLGWEEERIQSAMQAALELTGLVGMEQASPESLSIGQKKRVAIASTLVMDPELLILDEPTTGQDQLTLEPILRLVTELHQRGKTVLMITHDMEVVMQYATRVVVMAGGRVIADGPPQQVFLRDEILERADLHRPELLDMTAALNGGMSVWADSLDALVASIVKALGNGCDA